MNKSELDKILADHRAWLNDEPRGVRADLRGAYLRGADLRGAYLRGADLFNSIGNGAQIITMQTGKYTCNYVPDLGVLQIGCERHTWDEWQAFDADTIAEMDEDALDWWAQWETTLEHWIDGLKPEAKK